MYLLKTVRHYPTREWFAVYADRAAAVRVAKAFTGNGEPDSYGTRSTDFDAKDGSVFRTSRGNANAEVLPVEYVA